MTLQEGQIDIFLFVQSRYFGGTESENPFCHQFEGGRGGIMQIFVEVFPLVTSITLFRFLSFESYNHD